MRRNVLLLILAACTGSIGETPEHASPIEGPQDDNGLAEPSDQSAASAIPRLSRRELDATLEEAFGLSGVATRHLPPDALLAINPETGGHEEIFDTYVSHFGDYRPSEVLVQGISSLAFEVARDVSQNAEQVHELAGCTPEEEGDADCMRAFIERVGRLLWRRPLDDEERAGLQRRADSFRDESFYLGTRVVLMSLLQSPDFVYQALIGEEAPAVGEGMRRLTNYEVLHRLTYHFWGQGPDLALLARADGEAWSDDEYRALVDEMAADDRAAAQIHHLHAAWLRHEELVVTDTELADDMIAESEALLERALGEDGRWSDLFTSRETFVSPRLAEHYGMEVPSIDGWVEYGNEERAGILSHGSFLSQSATHGNGTLPSRRGSILADRILCTPIPPPPPDLNVDDGVEVEGGECKSDAYEVHRSNGACSGCHQRMDPLGFGFERFDGLGVYRTVERVNSECDIDGAGALRGTPFVGPRHFVDVALAADELTSCGVTQMMRYALRHRLEDEDIHTRERLHTLFVENGEDFPALMRDLALDPTFRYRKEFQ